MLTNTNRKRIDESGFYVGDLVEYLYPLPDNENMIGVILYMSEISSNVYERSYVEATVHWTAQRWNAKEKYSKKPSTLFETYEDVARLHKLT